MTSFREQAAAMRATVQQWRGDAALYTFAGGAPADARPCFAIIRNMDVITDVGGFPVRQTARFAILLTADVPVRPTEGATVALVDAAGAVTTTYTIVEDATSPDSASIEWHCRVGDPVPAI